MNQVSKVIRRFTVPPVFAAALLLIVYIVYPHYCGNVWHLTGGLIFLAVLPTLAYPLQKYIPHFKDRGREGQRCLAMIFSFAGYLLGTLLAFVFSAPMELKTIYLEYLLCGVGMLLLNKVFRIKASGHAYQNQTTYRFPAALRQCHTRRCPVYAYADPIKGLSGFVSL